MKKLNMLVAVISAMVVSANAYAVGIVDDLVTAADISSLSTAVSTILVGMVAFTVAFLAFALITRGLKSGKRA